MLTHDEFLLAKQELKKLSEERTLASLEEFPQSVRDKVLQHKKKILDQYPEVEEIYLVGSWANGSYVDETTSVEFKELRDKVKDRTRLSDFDYTTYPQKVRESLWPDIDLVMVAREEGIKIYDKNADI